MAIPSKEKYTNRILHSDVEARGFLDVVKVSTDVWCLVSRDDETKEIFIFHDYPQYDNAIVEDGGKEYIIPPRTGSLIEGARFWYLAGKNGSKLSTHNSCTYDETLIKNIWPKCEIEDSVWIDTFILSKIQYFDRPQKKGARSAHGLLNYSLMEGNPKPKVEDFTIMNAFMLHRCIIDVGSQDFCYNYLKKEAELLKKKNGIDFSEAYLIESEYARGCARQEKRGVLADVPHMEHCIELWDKNTDEIAAEVEPQLPPTVKARTGRVERSIMMNKLGYKKTPVDEQEEVKKDGEMVWQAKKPYYTPSTNFHKTIKTNQYSGFNISYGDSPTYIKKAELTKWIKDNHPDTKPKEWDIEKGETEIKVLNKNCCEYFEVEETDTDLICGAHTRVVFSDSKLTQHEVVKSYLIKLGLKTVDEWNLKRDGDNQIVKATENMTIHYPSKASYENQMHLDIKKGEAIMTSPKVGEKDYSQLPDGIGQRIGEYNTTVHRRRFLSNPKDPENKGLLAYVREDGRLPCGVNNSGCSTLRSSHRVWVNAAGVGALYGEEIRSCLIAPEGRVLIGCDMASAQLAISAFLSKNIEYYEAVASGKENIKDENGKEIYQGKSAHCFSARNFGLVSQGEWEEAVETQEETLLHSIMLRRKKSKGSSFGVNL